MKKALYPVAFLSKIIVASKERQQETRSPTRRADCNHRLTRPSLNKNRGKRFNDHFHEGSDLINTLLGIFL